MRIISESIQKYNLLIGNRRPNITRQSDYEFLDLELTNTALGELKRFRRGENSETSKFKKLKLILSYLAMKQLYLVHN